MAARNRLVALRVSEDQVLRHYLKLPAAAVARMDLTLRANLGVWTPFSADEVYAACATDDAGAGVLRSVELRCVPRSGIDEKIQILHSFGIEPDEIQLGSERFVIVRPTPRRYHVARLRFANAVLTTFLSFQAIFLPVVLIQRQKSELEELESQRAPLQLSLRELARAERQRRERRGDAASLAQEMDASRSFSRALRVLADILPNGVHVRQFEANRERNEGHVTLVGPKGIDAIALLSGTRLYRPRDVMITPAATEEERVFSLAFELDPRSPDNETSR